MPAERFFIAPVVEGYGEVEAVPVLLHRLLREVRPDAVLRVNPAIRVKAGSFLHHAASFHRSFELAARKARAAGGSVLILLDSEDDCPATLGPMLAARAAEARPDVPTVVALAYREYETWFLATARSLQGIGGLASTTVPENPESIRDAKGWLSARMELPCNPPIDQPEFTRRFSFEEAAAVPSFARLRRKLQALFHPEGP